MAANKAPAASDVSIETGHQEMIHDAQLDYYGKRLATASSDKSIRVFEIVGQEQRHLATLNGHQGPVWQVAWSHPKNGNLLASCSYDRTVAIWREDASGWEKIFTNSSHQASVNTVAWAPHTLGTVLACGSSDGSVSVFTYDAGTQTWQTKQFEAHLGGVTALSWAPDRPQGAMLQQGDAAAGAADQPLNREFVTCGCDNAIKVWQFSEAQQEWVTRDPQEAFDNGENQHADWVRDVAWAPNLGLQRDTIASCSEDRTVVIWTRGAANTWRKAQTLTFEHKVWRVSWSNMGNILAVSQGDNNVSLWKEALDGTWTNLTDLDEADAAAPGPA